MKLSDAPMINSLDYVEINLVDNLFNFVYSNIKRWGGPDLTDTLYGKLEKLI